MRTTVDLPEHVLRYAKAAASLAGKTLKTFVTEALESKIASETGKSPSRTQTQLPLVRSKSPGSLKLDGEKIGGILESEDIRALGGH